MKEIYELTPITIAWIIITNIVIGIFIGMTMSGVNPLDYSIEYDRCVNISDYAMFQFIEEEPTAQHKFIRIEYNKNCILQNIYEWVEDENSFKTIYFRDYE